MHESRPMPTRSQLEMLRLPAALILLVIAGIVLVPRFGSGNETATPSSTSSIAVDEISGVAVDAASPSPIATPTPSPTATPAPTATPRPAAAAGAELFACRRISGSQCRRELHDLERDDRFTALVRFDDARVGDTVEVVLRGASGTVSGGPYTLDGGGEGYYYASFSAGGLPEGEYTLAALWNGVEVDTLSLER
jgi:hypothetical protein